MIDHEDAMRTAMGHFATGVTVVTARAEDGRPVGTTVNAIASVSLRPPLLLVCLARDSVTLAVARESGSFVVNVLGEHQHELSARFATKGDRTRPHEVDFGEDELGLPHLRGSLATIACSVDTIHGAGDHEIVIAEALATSIGERDLAPLLYFRGSYPRMSQGTCTGALDGLNANRSLTRTTHGVSPSSPHMPPVLGSAGAVASYARSPMTEKPVR